MDKYIALPVAATAYPHEAYTTDTPTRERTHLTHIVDTQQDDAPLCSRVRPGSILRDYALAQPASTATCVACQSQYRAEQSRVMCSDCGTPLPPFPDYIECCGKKLCDSCSEKHAS